MHNAILLGKMNWKHVSRFMCDVMGQIKNIFITHIITSCATVQALSLSKSITVKECLPSLWCLVAPVHLHQVLMTQT